MLALTAAASAYRSFSLPNQIPLYTMRFDLIKYTAFVMTHSVGLYPCWWLLRWFSNHRKNGVISEIMVERQKILIEVMYKADYCLPCLYMDETVREILPKYEKHIHYRRVDFMRGSGKERFLELSYSLFGEDNVRKYRRVAPVPSLFIEGELVFDAIPPIYELEEAIEEAIQLKGLNT